MNEEIARVRINAMIKDAGFGIMGEPWDVQPVVRYEGDILDEPIRNKLSGKKPDYHFYEAGSKRPIAFLEAKRPGSNLNAALDQATKYAKRVSESPSPAMIVFASDGFQVRSRHADGSDLLVNGYPLDYIPNSKIMAELIDEPALHLGEKIKNANELIDIFGNTANYMRRDGIEAGMAQLREFCIMLFIKIMSEQGKKTERRAWSSFEKLDGQELKKSYQSLLKKYDNEYRGLRFGSEIKNPEVVKEIIKQLSRVNFTISEIDVKGEAFEFFLKNYSAGKKSSLGQYFTPRHVVKMMSTMLRPELGDRIFDPFCGTGGMLIECYKQIKMGLSRELHKRDLDQLNKNTLFGTDISQGASSLAIMNMVLLGDGHSNINNADSFEREDGGQYDKVITNIPFNIADVGRSTSLQKWVDLSGIEKPDMNSRAIIKCIESLKKGGSGAIVVPLTMCVSKRYAQIRDYIASRCRIKACLRLPAKTFISYTTAQTAVLLFDGAHESGTKDFVYIHIENDGLSQNKKREPVPGDEMPRILELAMEDRLADFAGSATMSYKPGGNFIEFGQTMNPNFEVWKLRDLLEIKGKTEIKPDEWYVEPRLESQNNTVSPGDCRLGKNIKERKKIFAEPGDLIIGTLHTNNNNGMFAISNGHYICQSQIVARIKEGAAPPLVT